MTLLEDALWSERRSHSNTTSTSGVGNSWSGRRAEAGSGSRLALTGDGADDPACSLVHHDPQLMLVGDGCLAGGGGGHRAQA